MIKVSVSDLNYFNDCRRSFLWGKKYFDRKPAPPLWFGTGVHAGLEAYFRDGLKSREKALVELNSWALSSFQKLSRVLHDWEGERPAFETALEDAQALVQNFIDYEQEERPFFHHVAATEVKLEYMITPAVKLVGRLDLVVQDDLGRVYVVDHKTFREPPNEEVVEIDEQLTAYAYLFWKTTGTFPDFAAYNVLLKGRAEMPALLKSGSLSKSRSQITTPTLYRRAILLNGLQSVDYVDFLQYLESLGWSQFFDKVLTTRSITELENFEARTLARVEDIARVYDDPEGCGYPSPSIYRCGWCNYKIACKMKDCGEDFESYLNSRFTTAYLY